MNKCFLCKKNNHLSKVRNGGYICNDCYWNCTSRFIKCDQCNIVIDMDDDYIVYCEKTDNDVCEDCYKNIMKIHSHHYEPKIKFYHKENEHRWRHPHIGIELELITEDKSNFLNKYMDNFDDFYFKYDGSLGNKGIEIVSMPMTSKVIAKHWKPMFNLINQYKFKANHSCGLHFHIDREYLDLDTIKNIDYLINNNHDYFSNIGGRNFENNKYCLLSNKNNNCWGINIHGKYCAVNLMKKNTVELRFCASTSDYDKFIDRLKTIYATIQYCKYHTFNYITTVKKDFMIKEIKILKRKLDI